MRIALLVVSLLLAPTAFGCSVSETPVSSNTVVGLEPEFACALQSAGQAEASCVRFSPDGDQVIAATHNRLHVIEWRQGSQRLPIEVPGYVCRLVLSADGKLAGVGTDRDAAVVDLITRKLRTTYGAGDRQTLRTFYGVTPLQAGHPLVLMIGQSGKLVEWNWEAGIKTDLFRLADSELLPKSRFGTTAGSFAAREDKVVVLSVRPGFIVYDLATKRETHFVRVGSGGGCTQMAFSPDGKILAVEQGRIVWFYDTATWTLTAAVARVDASIGGLAFSPDGKTLYATAMATVNSPSNVIVYDPASGAQLGSFQAHNAEARPIAVSPDGKHLATAGSDGLKVWSVANVRKELGLDGK